MQISVRGLTLFIGNMSENGGIAGATSRNNDSGKLSARCPKKQKSKTLKWLHFDFQIFRWSLPNLTTLDND